MSKKKKKFIRHTLTQGFQKYAGQLEIVEWDVIPASAFQRKATREEFHDVGRNEFYKYLAKSQPTALSKIGFNQEQIEKILESGLQHIGNSYPRSAKRFNVDHILGVYWEGSHNRFDNLCLIPKNVNTDKANLETNSARPLDNGKTRIQTLIPTRLANGQYRSHVTSQSNTSRKRIAALA